MENNEKPTPLWKKEISFRRKPAEREPDSVAASAEPAATPDEPEAQPASTSVWKKEVSFRKKIKPVPAPVEPELATVAEPELLPELELALEAVLLDAEPEMVPEIKPEPEPEFELEPAAEIEHSWLTKPLEEVSEPPEEEELELAAVADEVEAVVDAVVEDPAEEALEPVSVLPQIDALDPEVASELLTEVAEVVSAEAAALPELDAHLDFESPALAEVNLPDLLDLPELLDIFDLPAAILPGAEAEAAESAPVADAPPKVPFYKRDLSSKRAPRERKPRAERPKHERAPTPEAAGKQPFYKREFSLKRGPKEWDAAEPPSEPNPKPESRFKLQLKKSEPKAKAASKAASDRGAKITKVPRPKLRRASLPKPSLPAAKGAKKLVGLKIGASQIAAARIVNGDEPELVQIAREPLDPGIVVGGELRDPEALALALKEFFRKHKLPKRGVRLGIANNRIGVRTFEVAGIDDPKQLANAIRFRAQEVLPIPIEEAVLDYQILSESTDADGVLTRRVLLVVAYRELVDRYVHACRKAGIEIVGIDLEAFALLRALAEPRTPVPGDERGALVAVSVGHDRSTFAVSDGRNCEFTRVLEWGGWALNVAIARALDLSPSEAEPVKRALSFTGTELPPEGYDESQLEAAREAARKQLQSFARELVSSLQFYQNQPDSLGIGEIVLTGGTTHLPGFAAELQRLIGVPVRVGDPLARVKVSKRIRESDQTGSFAIAIGLGIDD